GMFLIIILYQKSLASRGKIILVSIFSILAFGLFATFSKSAILAFIIVLLFFLVGSFIFKEVKENRQLLSKSICLFTFVAIIFSSIFWEPVATRVRGTGRLEAKSTNERISYFGESWQLIKNHPFLGVGLGNYTLALHNEINPNLNSWEYQPAHNIYLLVLAELGVVGFLVFTGFLLYFLFSLQKNISWYNLFDPRNTVFFLILLVGLFDHYFWTLYFGIILFWIYLSLVVQKEIS
ncbi:MAG TPA: O-antigen ligase family protein, partial [Patescibacteria group bacterium]|nr:O-antigen ligase family protein [Patescibacteria group bacterium]